MGRVAASVDNCTIDSFWSIMQRHVLDTRTWDGADELGAAIYRWAAAGPG